MLEDYYWSLSISLGLQNYFHNHYRYWFICQFHPALEGLVLSIALKTGVRQNQTKNQQNCLPNLDICNKVIWKIRQYNLYFQLCPVQSLKPQTAIFAILLCLSQGMFVGSYRLKWVYNICEKEDRLEWVYNFCGKTESRVRPTNSYKKSTSDYFVNPKCLQKCTIQKTKLRQTTETHIVFLIWIHFEALHYSTLVFFILSMIPDYFLISWLFSNIQGSSSSDQLPALCTIRWSILVIADLRMHFPNVASVQCTIT